MSDPEVDLLKRDLATIEAAWRKWLAEMVVRRQRWSGDYDFSDVLRGVFDKGQTP